MLREFLLADGEVIRIGTTHRATHLQPDRCDQTFKSEGAAIAQFEKNYLRHLLTEASATCRLAARMSHKTAARSTSWSRSTAWHPTGSNPARGGRRGNRHGVIAGLTAACPGRSAAP